MSQQLIDDNSTDKKMRRLASMEFANLFQAFMEASDEVQQVIRTMAEIVSDDHAEPDEREAAVSTLVEALFPSKHNGNLGIDIDDLRTVQTDEVKTAGFKVSDEEELTFSQRLASIMEKKGIGQSELASRIGVGQPAISMMLNRQCRPQRRTIRKIADALNVDATDLWPSLGQ